MTFEVSNENLALLGVSVHHPVKILDTTGRYTLGSGAIIWVVSLIENGTFYGYEIIRTEQNQKLMTVKSYNSKMLEGFKIDEDSIQKKL